MHFFLILLFSNADFRSSAVFHFFYTATRLLYASTPFLLSFCLSGSNNLLLKALLYAAVHSFETTTASIKYTQDAYCTNQKETDGPLNVIYTLLFQPTHRWTEHP